MAVCHHHSATFKSPNVFTSLPSSTDDGLPALEGADPVTADERKGSTVQSLGADGSVAGGPGEAPETVLGSVADDPESRSGS